MARTAKRSLRSRKKSKIGKKRRDVNKTSESESESESESVLLKEWNDKLHQLSHNEHKTTITKLQENALKRRNQLLAQHSAKTTTSSSILKNAPIIISKRSGEFYW